MRILYNLPVMLVVGMTVFGIVVPIGHTFYIQRLDKANTKQLIKGLETFESRILFKFFIYDILSTSLYIGGLYYLYWPTGE